MGTRALIVKEYEKGKYVGTNVLYDGYPTHVGSLLLDYFNEEGMVNRIINEKCYRTLEKPKLDDKALIELDIGKCDKYDEEEIFNYSFDYAYIYTIEKKWVLRRSAFDKKLYDLNEAVNEDLKNTPFYMKRPFGLYGFFNSKGEKRPSELVQMEAFFKKRFH